MTKTVQLKPLLRFIFCVGILIIIIGFLGQRMLPGIPGFAFLNGGLSLGGGLIICWIFAIKNQWLGLIGAGIVSLIGFCKSITNLKGLMTWLIAPSPKPTLIPLLQISVAAMTFIILVFCIRSLLREKTRRILDELQ
jgi:hypothetical protein